MIGQGHRVEVQQDEVLGPAHWFQQPQALLQPSSRASGKFVEDNFLWLSGRGEDGSMVGLHGLRDLFQF